MKSSPKPPPVPDPSVAINAQAAANRVDQYTPFGNTIFSQAPGSDQWQSNYEFSEPVQNLFNQTMGMFDGQRGIDNEYTDAMNQQSGRLIKESFDPQIESFQQEMANRGIPELSDAYNDMYRTRIGDPMQRAYDDSAFRSIAAGDQRKLQDYNMLSNVWGRGQVSPTMPLDALTPYRDQQSALDRNYQSKVQQRNAEMNAVGDFGAAAVGKK